MLPLLVPLVKLRRAVILHASMRRGLALLILRWWGKLIALSADPTMRGSYLAPPTIRLPTGWVLAGLSQPALLKITSQVFEGPELLYYRIERPKLIKILGNPTRLEAEAGDVDALHVKLWRVPKPVAALLMLLSGIFETLLRPFLFLGRAQRLFRWIRRTGVSHGLRSFFWKEFVYPKSRINTYFPTGFLKNFEAVPAHFPFSYPSGDRLRLAPGAQELLTRVFETSKASIVYSDEMRGGEPWFKPDWDLEHFLAQDYISSSAFFHPAALQKIGGPQRNARDTLLKLIEHGGPPVHLSHLLVSRDGESLPPIGRTTDEPSVQPRVTLIIPTRDHVKLLKGIVSGILEDTDYPAFEILIVNNQSRERATLQYLRKLEEHPGVRVLAYDAPFNYSAMNNLAAREAQGEVLGFLNNDLLVIHRDWLSEMVRHAVRPDVGAVGAKLLFPDDSIQHGGVVLGIGRVAGHALKHSPRHGHAQFDRLHCLQQYSAVTGACLFTSRELFLSLGGFEADRLPVAFNDVDYCLRVREAGRKVLWTPYAELYHLESLSRGADDKERNTLRYSREEAYMHSRWGALLEQDPFYNRHLTFLSEDFAYAFPPRPELT